MDQKHLDTLEEKEAVKETSDSEGAEKVNEVNDIINGDEEGKAGAEKEVKTEKDSAVKKEVKAGVSQEVKKDDPWDFDEGEKKSGSGWKFISIVLLILLVAAVYTNGFNFNNSSTTGAVASSVITKVQAEKKVLEYVNNNLLTAPFLATVKSSVDSGSLYKITLEVSGQTVDSYLTKDGKIFFPQGFDITKAPVAPTPVAAKPATVSKTASANVSSSGAVKPAPAAANTTKPVVAAPPVKVAAKEIKVVAKKWRFDPNRVAVKKGDVVKLTVSSDLDLNFALAGFNVKGEVLKGASKTFSFTADKVGTFAFSCGDYCVTKYGAVQGGALQGSLVVS